MRMSYLPRRRAAGKMRLYGLETNAEIAADSRERLKRERRAHRAGADFIGPLSPYQKGRAPKR
jgi:hypothetical protein